MHRLLFFAAALAVLIPAVAMVAEPAPPGAPVEPTPARIVDFGADYAWHFGIPFYRGLHNKLVAQDVDVDGDGRTDDDSVGCLAFSLDEPFNPIEPWYDPTAASAIFYGGGAGFFGNRAEPRMPEGGINVDHELRDDFNWHGYNSEDPDDILKLYAAWIWKKEDFRGGGDAHRVSLGAGSRMAVHVSRYWNDYDEARFVAGQDGRLYISEFSFRGHRQTHVLRPAQTRWAAWEPEAPYHIAFDPEAAEFAERGFDDVDAVGWYVAKDSATRGECWLKWYAFEVEAAVHRPRSMPRALEMLDVSARRPLRPHVPPFAISRGVVPYETWHRVYKWATSNQFCFEPGYVFDRDGDMGGMDAGGGHTAREPVTDITWLDAVAWCNALSETEGLTPCYYEDGAHERVLRKVRERVDPARYGWRPDVHVKWDADGYRLPAPAELEAASGEGAPVRAPRWPLGPASGFRVVRSFRGGRPPPDGAAVPVSAPMVEGPTGGPLPEMVAVPGGSFTRVDEAQVHVSPFFMGHTEVTFAQWRRVYEWAAANGYRIDRDGDMGSMDWEPGSRAHTPDEPVTDVGWYDAISWCNALSEMEGRTHCYYADPERTRPYRASLPFRLRMYQGGKPMPERPGPHLRMRDEVYVRWEADGYRLPTEAEWEYAYRAGSVEHYRFPWGDEPIGDHAWYDANSDRTTHPVGQKNANPFGLHDMAGNVYEYVWGGPHNYYRNRDPKGDWQQGAAHNVRGGSFRLTERYSYHMRPIQRDRVTASASYPEIGFRVVRCEAGTHPAEGEPTEETAVLDLDPAEFDPLQGRVFRGNLMRTGHFEASGPAGPPGLKWTFPTEGPVISSPVEVDGLVYVGSDDGRVYAVEAEEGRERWRFEAGAPVRSSAAVHQGVVYIGGDAGYLHALDAATGDELWKFGVEQWGRHFEFPVANSPAPAHGVVFFGLGLVRGVGIATQQEAWRYREGGGLRDISSVAIGGGLLVYGGDGPHIVAARLRTERTAWKYNNASDHFVCTPAVSGASVYATGTRGIAAIDIATGRDRWEHREDHWPRDPLFSSPAVADGIVYCGNEDGSLYALAAADGELLWTFPTGGQVASSPAVADGAVYFGSHDGHLYAVDARTGDELWRFEAGSPIASSPWIGDGVVYFGCHDGRLYALR